MPFIQGMMERGWGVFCCKPWSFVGLFPNKDTAEARAQEMGPHYEVRFGEHQTGTDNFIWTTVGGTH